MRKTPTFAQDSEYKAMLHTQRWHNLRRQTLAAHPQCEQCAREHRYRLATEVHHRVPVLSVADTASRIGLMYDPGNLMALCHDCHVAVHRSLGKQTKEENRRRTEGKVDDIMRRYGIAD